MAAQQAIGTTPRTLETRPRAIRFDLQLPSIARLETVPRRLRAEDEAELRWYLDAPLIANLLQGSGFGNQLERAEAFGYGALPCVKCGGRYRVRRRKKDGKEVVIGWRDGTGRQPKKRFGKQESYMAALARYRTEQRRSQRIVIASGEPTPELVEEHWQRGEMLMTEETFREAFPSLPDDWTRSCQRCGGIGVVPRRLPTHAEVTVWPTGSSKGPGATKIPLDAKKLDATTKAQIAAMVDGHGIVSFWDLARYQLVDSILRDVAAISPIARAGLEAYYAPQATTTRVVLRQVRRDAKHGYAALEPLTPAFHEPKGEDDGDADRKSRMVAQRDALFDHASKAWNLAAYGAGA